MIDISLDQVTRSLASRISLYRWRKPVYQAALLSSLGKIWDSSHRSILDIGGGTGIMAQTVKELFPVDSVVSIDIEDRYLDHLSIDTRTYDGTTLPFADDRFDCALMLNVLHHVPKESRASLLKECGRVARTIYIKDHLPKTALDHTRLAILDLLGNVPFGGMVQARYLERAEWQALAEQAGFRIEDWQCNRYRSGPMEWIFPNSLEVLMKWTVSEGRISDVRSPATP
jgi:ubiquinone/menaquinone biosynthesis C-methylase UbiE